MSHKKIKIFPKIATPIEYDGNVKYIVEHYKADDDGAYPDDPTETEIFDGEIGDTVTAEPKSYDGYCLDPDAIGGETYIFTANFKKNTTPKEPDYPKYIPIPRVQEKPAKINRDDHYAYIVGYPDGTVRPEGSITRAEVATIFFRLLDEDYRDEVYCDENDFYDVNEGDWFNNAVSTLSAAGIMNGYPDGSFRPNAYITRAETMTMVNRVMNRLPKNISRLLDEDEMLTFPDNQPGDWYYIAVQKATNSHSYDRYDTDLSGDEQWVALIPNFDWILLER